MSDDAEAMAIFDDLIEARVVRRDAQLQRIDGTAYWLGCQLSRHEITKDDADRRLEALCSQRDPEVEEILLALVPWDMAEDAAVAGLRRGMEGAR
jgi:hypothetical protein